MTTTLRPVPAGDPGVYAICANGRPIGGVHLTRHGPWGAGTGWIVDIRVLPTRRRRGHACVAMLAAEEIMRGWRCTRVALAVPEGNTAAAGLARALGYGVDSVRLAAPAHRGAPPGIRPLEPGERAAWTARAAERHAARLRAAGWTPDSASTRAAAHLAPQEPAVPPYVLGDEGGVWVADGELLALEAASATAATTLLRAAAHLAARQGAAEIAFDVGDPGIEHLSTDAGFTVRSRYWTKPIL